MNLPESWETEYQSEIANANAARSRGNEGMARVCARRAVSVIIGEYLQQKGLTYFGSSVVDRIFIFDTLPDVDTNCKRIASHFLLKVDTGHQLPVEADLIREAEWLAKVLLPGKNG